MTVTSRKHQSWAMLALLKIEGACEHHADKYSSSLPADHAQNSEDFMALMQQRFLAGADHEHVDYAAIDKNASLDDDWAAQAEEDAQEKYFDAD